MEQHKLFFDIGEETEQLKMAYGCSFNQICENVRFIFEK